MASDADIKNPFRLRDPAELPAHPEVKPLQESELVLHEMAEAYLGSSPRLFEIASLFLNKKQDAPVVSPANGDDPAYTVLTVADDGALLSCDEQAEELFGYALDEIVGKNVSLLLNIQDKISALSSAAEGRRRDGAAFPVRVRVSSASMAGKTIHTILVRDLSGSVAVAGKQQGAEARYRTLVEQIPAVTFMASLDEQAHELYVSPQIEGLLGFSPEKWISDPIRWFHQIHPDDRERMSLEFARSCIEGGSFRGEFRVLTRDKRVLWVHCEARMVRDDKGEPLFLQGVGFDITESKTAEEKVRASLREKEVLLKEIHHRVKNNLQITSSLLRLQAPRIKDKDALAIFTESESRIRSMALVHEKLYQSKDMARIEFAAYIRELCSYLAQAYSVSTSHIRLKFELEEGYLGIDQAVPCALILNELVSNSIKHAFPEGRRGEVAVQFSCRRSEKTRKKECCLVVQDDGVGIPSEFDVRKSKSLGLTLVTNLTKQLDGRFVVLSAQPGSRFELVFPSKT